MKKDSIWNVCQVYIWPVGATKCSRKSDGWCNILTIAFCYYCSELSNSNSAQSSPWRPDCYPPPHLLIYDCFSGLWAQEVHTSTCHRDETYSAFLSLPTGLLSPSSVLPPPLQFRLQIPWGEGTHLFISHSWLLMLLYKLPCPLMALYSSS